MWEPSPVPVERPPEVRIRPFNYVDDCAPILSFLPDLYELNFPGFVIDTEFTVRKRNQLQEASHDPGQVVLVAEDSVGICGFIWLMIEIEYRRRRRGEVSAIYVHPRVRGRGVGRRLMEKGEDYLRAYGCQSVMLMVTATNTVAHGLYESLGYGVTRHQMEKRLKKGSR